MNNTNPVPLVVTPSEFGQNDQRRLPGIGYWNAYVRSSEYQSLQPKNDLISEEELLGHRNADSMWMALRKQSELVVYDVTKFSEYHPGGYDLIAENAGTDASEAFRCAHAYVSLNMISRLQKGIIAQSSRLSKTSNYLLPSMNTIVPLRRTGRTQSTFKKPTWDWSTSSTASEQIALRVFLNQDFASLLPRSHVLITFTQSVLTLRVLRNRDYYYLKIRLLPSISPELHSWHIFSGDAEVGPGSSYVHVISNPQISIPLNVPREDIDRISSLGSVLGDQLIDFDKADSDTFFSCRVVASWRFPNSNYRCLRLAWPKEEANVAVPISHHIFIRVTDKKGCEHTRPYTPIYLELLDPNLRVSESATSKSTVDLLIKVLLTGCVSRILDEVNVGDSISVSLPSGRLKPSVFLNVTKKPFTLWKSVCMLVGGSGVTPCLRVIHHYLCQASSSIDKNLREDAAPRLQLFWFNRALDDLSLAEKLCTLSDPSENDLKIRYIITEEPCDFNLPEIVMRGQLTDDVCRNLLKPYTFDYMISRETCWLTLDPEKTCVGRVDICNELKERFYADTQPVHVRCVMWR